MHECFLFPFINNLLPTQNTLNEERVLRKEPISGYDYQLRRERYILARTKPGQTQWENRRRLIALLAKCRWRSKTREKSPPSHFARWVFLEPVANEKVSLGTLLARLTVCELGILRVIGPVLLLSRTSDPSRSVYLCYVVTLMKGRIPMRPDNVAVYWHSFFWFFRYSDTIPSPPSHPVSLCWAVKLWWSRVYGKARLS